MAEHEKYCLPEGLPVPTASRDGLGREFFEAARRHELVVQRCRACGTFRWGPEWLCHNCHSPDSEWPRLSGRGRIYSWIRTWNPVHPALRLACPYIVVLVALPEAGNVRMVGNLIGDPMQNPPFGAEVAAVFEDHEEATLIQWKLV